MQNPLTALADDIATTERAVEAQTGSIVLVGHSYGGASVPEAAWKTIPSWYLVAQDDRAINPELQRFYVRRMGARSTEVKSSHVPFLSHPAEVARVIEAAAASR